MIAGSVCWYRGVIKIVSIGESVSESEDMNSWQPQIDLDAALP